MKSIRSMAGHLVRGWSGAPLLGLVYASLVLSSCGETPDALAPDATSTVLRTDGRIPDGDDDLLNFSTKRVLTFLVPPLLTDPRSASKLIRANEGGFVELAGFRVDVPAGALAADTEITIDLPTNLPEANYVVADFGPDGLTFSKAVKLTFPLLGVDLGDVNLAKVKVWFWNGSRWKEPRGGITGTAVTSNTFHFSTYGARSGIDTTSGG